jgi:fucose 4-O-acetylase-like acetyltransferase
MSQIQIDTCEANRRPRNDTIELLRIVSACGVVWFHMETTAFKRVSFAGLVFFLVISVVFQRESAKREKAHVYFQKRVTRLVFPWMVWFAIYGLLNLVRGKELLPYSSEILPGILAGPWIGLWYLPFSFISAGLTYGLLRLLKLTDPILELFVWGALSVIGLVTVSVVRSSHTMDAPWAQWLHAAPSIPVGMALACATRSITHYRQKLCLLQAALLVACVSLYRIDPGTALSYGIGTLLVSGGLAFSAQLPPLVGRLSELCMGVYLIHGAVMAAAKVLPMVTQYSWTWYTFTILVSFCLIAVVRRVPLLGNIT